MKQADDERDTLWQLAGRHVLIVSSLPPYHRRFPIFCRLMSWIVSRANKAPCYVVLSPRALDEKSFV